MLSFYIQDLYYTCYFDCFMIFIFPYLWAILCMLYTRSFLMLYFWDLGPFVLYYYAFLNLFDIFMLNFNIWEWICVFLCYHSDIMRVLTNVFLFLFPPVCTWVCSQCECHLAGLFVLLWFYVSVLVLILLCMTFLCMKVT